MTPVELGLELVPRARLDLIDVRARAAAIRGRPLAAFKRCLYASAHTTAGFLPQSLAARLAARPQGVASYLELFRTMFPQDAGYLHDQIELRQELLPHQRSGEPANADSHLAFIGGGLHSCVSYNARRPGPAYFVDLDGMHNGTPRRRRATLVGYDTETEVARMSLEVPVSAHPIDAVNLKDPQLGLHDIASELIARHGVTKGRLRIELASPEQYASLTVNEYETLLMQHDLAEVLRNPLRFAAEKARHVWNDPRAVPAKAAAYAQYDLVRAINRLMDALGLNATRIESLLARTIEVPASRFLRMRRSIDLLVSDSAGNGTGAIVSGAYQAPILVQWRPATRGRRQLEVALTRFQ